MTLILLYENLKKLHVKYVIQLLEETIKALKNLKNINTITISTSLTVIGDLHGQIDDLLMIFYKVFKFRFNFKK